MSDDTPFLSRWSRLKQQGETTPVSDPVVPQAAPSLPAVAPDDQASDEEEDPEADLPPLETLGRDSDYTGFLNPKVSDQTRNAALSKLWRSDPVFAVRDGLNDHDEDYTKPAIVGAAVRTLWKAVGGYLETPEAEEADADRPEHEKSVKDDPEPIDNFRTATKPDAGDT